MNLYRWKLTWEFVNGLTSPGATGMDRWTWGSTHCTDGSLGRRPYKLAVPLGLVYLDGVEHEGVSELALVAGPFLLVIAKRYPAAPQFVGAAA